MREAGNLPACGYNDQLTELKADLDSLKDKNKHQQRQVTVPKVGEANGLDMLLNAASGTFSGQHTPRNNGGTNTPREGGGAFGVGDAMGALDDPFLQDFLQQPYGNWTGDSSFDPPPAGGLPSVQLQFDWENANLFGNL